VAAKPTQLRRVSSSRVERMSSEALIAFGARVRMARRAQDITQGDLGRAIGDISASYISQIENGHNNITIDVVAKICSALGLSFRIAVRHPRATPRG
jgi:transcriptional regulator with XRE-family HTH domain